METNGRCLVLRDYDVLFVFVREKYKTLKQAILYLLVGGSSALIELVLFYAFSDVFSASLTLSNVAAVIIATAFNFIVNGTVTFKSASSLSRSVILYLILFCFNTIFSTVVINYLASMGLPAIFAKIITMGCIVLWNFVLYKKVIFV